MQQVLMKPAAVNVIDNDNKLLSRLVLLMLFMATDNALHKVPREIVEQAVATADLYEIYRLFYYFYAKNICQECLTHLLN